MFENLERLPADPILKLIIECGKDDNPNKVDLGVGVYKDEAGNTPILESVKQAERLVFESQSTKAYIGPPGDAETNLAIQKLLFGAQHSVLQDQRTVTFQTPGGCGALRVATDLIKRSNENAKVWVSTPTWGNHIPLIREAGLQVAEYPYYDHHKHAVNFEAMLASLENAAAGDVLLLHGCCHNPCGADLNQEQWQTVAQLAETKGLVPFIDIAYQGFGNGIEEDAYGLRLMAENVPEMIVAASCSKNFGLYRERAGSISIIGANAAQCETNASQLASITRGSYSMPPSHGAAIVGQILWDDTLRQQWLTDVAEMRDRINALRSQLVETLITKGANQDFSFIAEQRGMFSFLGITQPQVQQLAQQYSIYMVDSSRISIAGINQQNIDYLSDAIVAVTS